MLKCISKEARKLWPVGRYWVWGKKYESGPRVILLIVIYPKVWKMPKKCLLSEQGRHIEEPSNNFRGNNVGERHNKNINQCCPRELLWWRNDPYLSYDVATSHLWLLSSYNITNAIWELNLIVIDLNVSSHICLSWYQTHTKIERA